MAEVGNLRVVLVGKTGAGKSSLGNTLLGDDEFMVHSGMSSGTVDNLVKGAARFGNYVQVTDTPGLCDTHRDQEEVLQEVESSVQAVHPGPHIILMVLRCDARFTKEEYSSYATLKSMFGEEMCQHMIVVFNGIDHLHDTPVQQRLALDEEVQKFGGSLRRVLLDADFRYYGVNNKAPWSSRDQSASALVHMMETLVSQNEGAFLSCSTPDLCALHPSYRSLCDSDTSSNYGVSDDDNDDEEEGEENDNNDTSDDNKDDDCGGGSSGGGDDDEKKSQSYCAIM